ncbi:uncharacterized protein A4U43_C02F1150 [Asparagus officinalis]|uniref:RING-type E3 ubiquitin transferase n=1 Tax=Asparagus officinalis TaxID=4686 RepID=A0A5P1FJ14_ASPOF|nr:E3 ubiquitin-protein ligase SDIR1-like [Asparagus officinalis]ONK76909.1 uncharacterized protein A4U43_C02F1150 [Asparagus officinalis]
MSRALGRNREDLEAGCAELLPEKRTLACFLASVAALILVVVNAHLLLAILPKWVFVFVLGVAAFIAKYGHCKLRRDEEEEAEEAQLDPDNTPRNRDRLPELRVQLALTERDFDDLDYEDLRALDEENPVPDSPPKGEGRGTPRFMVQSHIHRQRSKMNDFTCIICFERFVKGQLIRSLPCLHQFHADCVDPWLRKEGTCPTCKYRVGPSTQEHHTVDVERN